ncbi:hypothetical protein BGX26_001066 [Mortierella sp. AD094]|nr:hypothetical protein BGX26_001066 [Mortierella sp. AD094]
MVRQKPDLDRLSPTEQLQYFIEVFKDPTSPERLVEKVHRELDGSYIVISDDESSNSGDNDGSDDDYCGGDDYGDDGDGEYGTRKASIKNKPRKSGHKTPFRELQHGTNQRNILIASLFLVKRIGQVAVKVESSNTYVPKLHKVGGVFGSISVELSKFDPAFTGITGTNLCSLYRRMIEEYGKLMTFINLGGPWQDTHILDLAGKLAALDGPLQERTLQERPVRSTRGNRHRPGANGAAFDSTDVSASATTAVSRIQARDVGPPVAGKQATVTTSTEDSMPVETHPRTAPSRVSSLGSKPLLSLKRPEVRSLKRRNVDENDEEDNERANSKMSRSDHTTIADHTGVGLLPDTCHEKTEATLQTVCQVMQSILGKQDKQGEMIHGLTDESNVLMSKITDISGKTETCKVNLEYLLKGSSHRKSEQSEIMSFLEAQSSLIRQIARDMDSLKKDVDFLKKAVV